MLERNNDARNEIRFLCIEELVPQNHLLRKIEKAADFHEIYPMVEPYYCEDNGRPAVDPVVLVKIVLIWHLFGLRSLRQTLTRTEYDLLHYFIENHDIPLTYEKLYNRVWGLNYDKTAHKTMWDYILKIRKTVQSVGCKKHYLITERDTGYRFTAL